MTQATISNSFSLATIDDGKDGAVVQLSRSVILYNANSSGTSTSQQSFIISYALVVGNVTLAASSITNVSISNPTNITTISSSNSECTLRIANNKSASGVTTITLTGTYNNNSYTAKGTITIAANKAGADGERGKVGRFFYYGGTWNALDNTTQFVVNDAQAPYFSHVESGQTLYHVFNPDTNPPLGTMTMKAMWDATEEVLRQKSFNNKPWEQMTNDFKYIITNAIFSDFAKLGSAIISGDWKLSKYGTIYDASGTGHEIYSNSTTQGHEGTWTDTSVSPNVLYNIDNAYTLFNANYPNSNKPNANNFVPRYAEDWLTGKTYQHDAYVAGSIYTQSIQSEFYDIPADTLSPTKFIVGLQGRIGVWNYGTVNDQMIIILPTNIYSYYGQRVTIYNPHLGIGGTANVTYIVASEVYYDEDEDEWYYAGDNLSSPTLQYDYIRGIGIAYGQSSGSFTPVPINSYTPIREIEFTNGLVELMCVPSSVAGHCEWCVVNIGTNVLELHANVTS